jgi:hypothetical protein
MTFEEWWEHFNSCCPLDITDEEIAKWAWGASHEEGFSDGVKWALEQDANTLNKLRLTLEEDHASNQ